MQLYSDDRAGFDFWKTEGLHNFTRQPCHCKKKNWVLSWKNINYFLYSIFDFKKQVIKFVKKHTSLNNIRVLIHTDSDQEYMKMNRIRKTALSMSIRSFSLLRIMRCKTC